MIVWLDAQISPTLAPWITEKFSVPTLAVRDLNLRDAEDETIFSAARAASAILVTKDSDFLHLLNRHGAPPQVVWLTCGNTSNTYLKTLLTQTFPQALELIKAGEYLIEISDSWLKPEL